MAIEQERPEESTEASKSRLLRTLLRDRVHLRRSDRKLLAQERRRLAVEMYAQGFTFEQIAEELGYSSKSGAYGAFKSALESIPVPSVEEYRKTAELRLNGWIRSLGVKIRSGDARSIEVAIQAHDRLALLLGLNRPVAQEMRFPDGAPQSITVVEFGHMGEQVSEPHGQIIEGEVRPQLEAVGDPPGSDKVRRNGGGDRDR